MLNNTRKQSGATASVKRLNWFQRQRKRRQLKNQLNDLLYKHIGVTLSYGAALSDEAKQHVERRLREIEAKYAELDNKLNQI